MSKRFRLTTLVSANGFGHIRRQILVAREIRRRFSNLEVTFAVTEAQHRRFKKEIDELGPKVDVCLGVSDHSVRWRLESDLYTDKNLNGWETEWCKHKSLGHSDFVISDNLVAVLDYRPDAILFGSFLWHEVLATYSDFNSACQDFVSREIRLLDKVKPKMICNGALATPSVMNLTDPLCVSWMVDPDFSLNRNRPRNSILVHGGGTRTLDGAVRSTAKLLRANGYLVWTDLEDDDQCFDFTEESWSTIGFVICRPGAGTATECVKWRLPMLIFKDVKNEEAEFMRARLTDLRIAVGTVDELTAQRLLDLVNEILSKGTRARNSHVFPDFKISGVEESVNFLAKHWNLE